MKLSSFLFLLIIHAAFGYNEDDCFVITEKYGDIAVKTNDVVVSDLPRIKSLSGFQNYYVSEIRALTAQDE